MSRGETLPEVMSLVGSNASGKDTLSQYMCALTWGVLFLVAAYNCTNIYVGPTHKK